MIRDFTTKKLKPQIRTDAPGWKKFLFAFNFVNLWLTFFMIFFSACGSAQKTDMRSLAPAETIVYLESADLGEMLDALTANRGWENSASGKPDFSQLKDIQIAVAVSGFETSEKPLTDQSAVLNFKPNFVLIGDTHAWNSTANSIVENQIGKFARQAYGEDVRLEKSEKQSADFYVWTGADGRKLFAAASKGVIYVGNNEILLDKCLSVQRGETENLLKNENLERLRASAGENPLAFGYVSPEGLKQIANMAGVSTAIEASDEETIRNFVAKVLPDVLQKTAKEIAWTARKTGQGIEDKIFVRTDAEVSAVFMETLTPAPDSQFTSAEFLPIQFNSITFYKPQNPQIAWRSVLIVASNQMEAASARLLIQFSNAFFEPYGISDGEAFLSSVGTEIVTARFDEEGEKSVVIADVKDAEKVKAAIFDEINFKAKPEKIGAGELWQSEDKMSAAAFIENKVILGDKESVLVCLQTKESGKTFAKTVQFQQLVKESSVAATVTRDMQSAQKIVEILGKPKEEKSVYTSFFMTGTRFVGNGFERRTVSDFGLLGTIVENIGESGK